MTLGTSFETKNNIEFSGPKVDPYQTSIHYRQWFTRRFLKIYQNFTYFASYWASLFEHI